MNNEVNLILTKLKIVSEEKENGMYLCDKKHSKALLDYITNLQEEIGIRTQNSQYLVKYNDELEQRIDKAIKYIKKEDELYYIKVFCRDLLKILGDDE